MTNNLCKLCKKEKVTDPNPKIKICSLCRIEIELSMQYFINGIEMTREEYEKEIENAF
jgi:hypothetical protein